MAAQGTEAQIVRALLLRLEALTLSPALQVAWPDVAFNKPLDSDGKPLTYLEASIFQSPTETIAIPYDGMNRYSGLMQVAVVTPQNEGAVYSQQIAASIVTHFKRGTRFSDGSTEVLIVQPSYVSPILQDPPYTRTPVTIRYLAFAAQT